MTARKIFESNQRIASDAARPAALEAALNSRQLSLPLSQSSACDVCGTPFEIVRRRGRPQRFCSDPCRIAQAKAQRSDWSRVNWASRTAAKRNLSTPTGETPDVED
ncbi:hypothetical protein [Bradyrhizobium sp. UNPA324]|uniref:hypothetical protein n=1 Tax=Bradyrhizobium sp. UNPA324 TaxID=1141174 RepID=UPI00114E3710|nr:hypothetical protein [Bradyrhizobium sp. UNPA324]TQF31717.1 hypothetical protein UNPA324_20370 [Bradyrhizobium sp. UNPA324]